MNTAQFKQEFLTGYNAISSFGAPGYKDWEISTFLSKAQERIVLKRLSALGNKYRTGVEQTEKRRVDLSMLTTSALLSPAVSQNGTVENGTVFELPTNFMYTLNERAITSVLDCTYTGQYMMLLESSLDFPVPNLVPGAAIYEWHDQALVQIGTVVAGTNNFLYVTITSSTLPTVGQTISNGAQDFILKDIFEATYIANIKPVTHDEYNVNKNNPFKQPYEQLLWRMDYGNSTAVPSHEIVTDGTIYVKYYSLRYYRKPLPIIVGNIAPKTIDGLSAITQCELNSIIHREIIDEAVMIADADAEAKKVQINNIETQKSE